MLAQSNENPWIQLLIFAMIFAFYGLSTLVKAFQKAGTADYSQEDDSPELTGEDMPFEQAQSEMPAEHENDYEAQYGKADSWRYKAQIQASLKQYTVQPQQQTITKPQVSQKPKPVAAEKTVEVSPILEEIRRQIIAATGKTPQQDLKKLNHAGNARRAALKDQNQEKQISAKDEHIKPKTVLPDRTKPAAEQESRIGGLFESYDELRRAILYQEILDKPLALRENY